MIMHTCTSDDNKKSDDSGPVTTRVAEPEGISIYNISTDHRRSCTGCKGSRDESRDCQFFEGQLRNCARECKGNLVIGSSYDTNTDLDICSE